MTRSPRIGITTYGRNDKGRFTLPAKYVEAVRRAGGLPMLLPPGETRLDEWLTLVDALILTGGPDVDPALYGGARHPEITSIDRDPAICRIHQLRYPEQRGLNVILGGGRIAQRQRAIRGPEIDSDDEPAGHDAGVRPVRLRRAR